MGQRMRYPCSIRRGVCCEDILAFRENSISPNVKKVKKNFNE